MGRGQPGHEPAARPRRGDTAILTALLYTYEQTSLMDDAVQAAADRLAADRLADDRQHDHAALDTVNAEIHQAEQAIQRYLLAFEAGTLPERVCGDRLRELGTTVARLRASRNDLLRRLETAHHTDPTDDELAALRARIRDVVVNGSTPARKALLRALVHEIRVDARDHIQPVFRVPVSSSRTAGALEDTEVHDPKVRALGGDVEVAEHNTNHLPTVNGPIIRLPEPSGAGLRFKSRRS